MLTLFDSHFHIIDFGFPVIENKGFIPEQFLVSDYRSQTSIFNIVGGIAVAGSYHGFDNSHLIDALQKLGNNFGAIAQIHPGISDPELSHLNNAGIKGIRFNLKRGVYRNTDRILYLAQKVYDELEWHTELYIESSKLAEVYELITNLPSVSIDHLGITKEGFDILLKLVEKGVKVKASGFGRVELDVKKAMKQIVDTNPGSLMFGTDLPSTRAARPFRKEDLYLIAEIFDNDTTEKILFRNGMNFYGFE